MAVTEPEALWRPLGGWPPAEPRMTSHDIICEHTMVGYLTSTDGWFRSDGWSGVESHYGTGGKWGPDLGGHMDGKLFQWQSLLYQADANLNGNPNVISIENADNARAPIAPFTDAQLTTNINLIAWLCTKEAHKNCPATWTCHKEGIPAVLIPDTKPGRRGIGYHRQGIKGDYPDGLVPGGVKWSNATGKVCPDDARIHQIKTIIIPAVRRKLAGQSDGDDFDMDDNTFDNMLANVLNGKVQGANARDAIAEIFKGQRKLIVDDVMNRLKDQVTKQVQGGIDSTMKLYAESGDSPMHKILRDVLQSDDS